MALSQMEENGGFGSAKVAVIGVGGAGGNAVNAMVQSRMSGVSCIAAGTDKEVLESSLAEVKILLGPNCTEGNGAAAEPALGRAAALESQEEIRAALAGADMVFIVAGLGGGTGTGAAPQIARISRELGALTIAVVTKPFIFEGSKAAAQAEGGWQELRETVDSILTIAGERLRPLVDKDAQLIELFTRFDAVLLQAVQAINGLVNDTGYMNLDFADLCTVMKESGIAVMGYGEADGEGRAEKAAVQAVENQMFEGEGLERASGVLINITVSKESFNMSEMIEIANVLGERVGEDAEILHGVLYDDTLADTIRVTFVAAGVGGVREQAERVL